jgi:hypothetical protein
MRIIAAFVALVLATPVWTAQKSGVTATLRGVSAVSDRVANDRWRCHVANSQRRRRGETRLS